MRKIWLLDSVARRLSQQTCHRQNEQKYLPLLFANIESDFSLRLSNVNAMSCVRSFFLSFASFFFLSFRIMKNEDV